MFCTKFRIIRPAISIINYAKNISPISNSHLQFSTLNTNTLDNVFSSKRSIAVIKFRLKHDDIFEITKKPSIENVDNDENDILYDEFESGLDSVDNGLEDEIAEFFTARVIPYEESEASEAYFSAQCPVCIKKKEDKIIFVEKASGYSFCPWCKFYGKWEDLVAQYDMEDHLSQYLLDEMFDSSNIITEQQLGLLNLTPFEKFKLPLLQESEARINRDESHLIFPLTNETKNIVGFASFSLLHPRKSFKAVYQLLQGTTGIYCCKPTTKPKYRGKVIIVTSIADCIALSRSNRYAICFTAAPSIACFEWALQGEKQVYIWIKEQIHENLCAYLRMQKDMEIFLIQLQEHRQELIKRSPRSIGTAFTNAIRIFETDVIRDYKSIQDEVFNSIRRKEEQCGVKWDRYQMLNDILVGHRPGELTIFTGLTGTGKTTFMSEYSLDLCMQGVPTLWGSFEVDHIRLIETMLQQYLGSTLPTHLFPFRKLSADFSRIPMYTMAYYGQQSITSVLTPMMESVSTKGIRHVIIDNLQFMLGINAKSSDWWLDQDRAVGAFRNFATKFNCHVTLIVHPKKLQNGEEFGINNISGGARVTQEADNVMILQTKQKPNSAGTFAPKTLQIVKNRYGGTLGEMKLSFHKESKTFSSHFSRQNSAVKNTNNPYAKNT